MAKFVNGNSSFKDSTELYRQIGSGPEGPYVDGRILVGQLSKAFGNIPDGWGYEYVASQNIDFKGDPITFSWMQLSRKLQQRLNFLYRVWDDPSKWSDFAKYLIWIFYDRDNCKFVGEPQRFATFDDWLAYVRAIITNDGSVYTSRLVAYTYDVVDTQDTYPMLRRCRNSMYSHIRGRYKTTASTGSDTRGVSPEFDAGKFYSEIGNLDGIGGTKWWGNLGRNFLAMTNKMSVQGIIPIMLNNVPAVDTNNNDIVWISKSSRNCWNFPKVGQYLLKSLFCWDDNDSIYRTPGTPLNFQVQIPFLLYDNRQFGGLDTQSITKVKNASRAMSSVAIMVFPMHSIGDEDPYLGHNLWAFLMKPFGADTLITDYVDESKYEIEVQLYHRQGVRNKYMRWPVKQHNGTEESLLQFYNGKTGLCHLWDAHGLIYQNNIDTSSIPSGVAIARRDKTTNVRSSWTPVFQMRRRLPNAPLRIDPAYNK